MNRALAALPLAAVVLALAGCSAGAPLSAPSPVAPAAATQQPPPPPAAPDLEETICSKFTAEVMPQVVKAMSAGVGVGVANPPYAWAQRVLMRDDARLSHWAGLITTAVENGTLADPDGSQFAGYLGDAGLALAIVGGPDSTAVQAQQAAADVGEVNGYCKYDAS
jgi:hypothetical protein